MKTERITAITRREISRPLRWLLENRILEHPILDYGSGRGTDARRLKADEYDPIFQPLSHCDESFNTVLCTYVLNVVTWETEIEILGRIQDLLKADGYGIAYFSVRRDIPRAGTETQRWSAPNLKSVYRNSSFEIYEMRK